MHTMKIVEADINYYARCGKCDIVILPICGRTADLGTICVGPPQPAANCHTFRTIHAVVIRSCPTGEQVDLTALCKAFKCIKDRFCHLKIAYPKVGHGLPGPTWSTICKCIASALKCCNHTLVVCPPEPCEPEPDTCPPATAVEHAITAVPSCPEPETECPPPPCDPCCPPRCRQVVKININNICDPCAPRGRCGKNEVVKVYVNNSCGKDCCKPCCKP